MNFDIFYRWWCCFHDLFDLFALMTLPTLFVGAAGVAAGAVLLCNVAPWMVAKPQLATLDYLAAAKLQTLDSKKRTFMVIVNDSVYLDIDRFILKQYIISESNYRYIKPVFFFMYKSIDANV